MTDFTKLINRGHRRFIAQNKKRVFDRCDDCGAYALLLEYKDPNDSDGSWDVCENCYRKLENEENK